MTVKKLNRVKRVLLGILLLGISVPLIQHVTGFSNVSGLWGAVDDKEPVPFSSKAWFDGSYQEGNEDYLNEAFGFRTSFVRLHNQVQFSLFSIPHANGVVIGKEWYLYEKNYIRAYYGQDFIGDSLIAQKTQKLKFIQEKLAESGKQIIVVLAPGKGSFFPEYFPDSMLSTKSKTNYESYVEQFDLQQINHIDFNHWFLSEKGKLPHPLYAKGGIHWSKYGEILAADSMIRHIERISNRDLPNIVIDGFDVKAKNENGDYDIGKGMNLLFQIPTYPMAYPRFHIAQPDKNTTRTLFVADSYYWGMYHYNFSQTVFGHGQFWFYNAEIYQDDLIASNHVANINIREEVEKNDVIVLMSTDANLYNFAFGFIDQLYEQYQIADEQ
ncbi:MAG: hypothetical protein ACI865_001960 [Flavobacteriaceae bacterium]|jgi:hypothetical protein